MPRMSGKTQVLQDIKSRFSERFGREVGRFPCDLDVGGTGGGLSELEELEEGISDGI